MVPAILILVITSNSFINNVMHFIWMDMEKAGAAVPLPARLAVSLQGRVTDDTLL